MKSIKTRYKVIGATLIVLASIAIATPLAVEYYLVKWLHSTGATNADIGTVGVNLVTGRLWIRDLRANDPGGERQLEIGEVSINLAWVDLIRGRIGIDGASLQDSQINIAQTSDAIQVGGLRFELPANEDVPPPASSEPLAIRLGPVTISNVTFGYSDEIVSEQFVIRQWTMGEAATWLSLEQTPVEIDLGLASGTARINGSIRPFLEEIDVDVSVEIEEVDISAYEELLSNFGIDSAAGTLGLTGDAELRILASGVAGNARLTASLASASLAMPSHGVDQVSGSFELDASTTLTSGPSGQDIDASANVRIIDAGTRIRDLEMGLQDLSSDITVTYKANDAAALNGTAKLALEGLSSSIRPARASLLELGSIVVESLRFSSEDVQIAGVELSDINAFSHYHPEGIQVRNLVMGPSEFLFPREDRGLNASIEQIDIAGVDAYLARKEDGSILYGSIVNDIRIAAGIVASDSEESNPSPVPRLTLGGISVKQAEVEIHDLAVSPPLVTNIKPIELTIGTFDTSEPEKRTSITLLLSQDDLMTVKLEGNTTVTAPRPSADLALNLAGLQLHQVSPYIPGYQISRGRFSLDSAITIQNGEIDIGNKIAIDDLRIAAKAGNDVPALASTLAMPLDLALDLLRDGKGRIDLEIPITGNLENPEFSLDDIIATAMGRAMQKAAMSYVKTALQPLGALLMVGSLTQKATRPRFEPVKFDAGESTLNPIARDYLDKMSGLLTSRPGLTISVCGVATEKDRQVLLGLKQEQADQAATGTDAPADQTTSTPTDVNAVPSEMTVTAAELVALGNDRASAVTSYFIGSRDLEPDRIFSCSSTVEADEQATPRVRLLL